MLGYINEQRQLERIILNEANRALFGPRKIISKLVLKGYATSKIKEVMRELSEKGELDFGENSRVLIEKKLGENPDSEDTAKLLYKYGYKAH